MPFHEEWDEMNENWKQKCAQDIAEGVIACGLKLQKKAPKLHLFVTGILPRDLHPTPRREQVQQTNSILK